MKYFFWVQKQYYKLKNRLHSSLPKTYTMYIDGVDWQYELGEASDGTKLYPSLSCIKKHTKCWDQCGIVEVKVTFRRPKWVVRQNLFEK